MKIFLKIFGIAILIAIAVGFYFRQSGDIGTGDKIIGISVLATAFIFMPIFLIVRWKGKRLKDYTLSDENMKKMRDKGLD